MRATTKTEILAILKRDNITSPTDERIEEIADRFPGEYSNDQEYVEFQVEIAGLIMTAGQAHGTEGARPIGIRAGNAHGKGSGVYFLTPGPVWDGAWTCEECGALVPSGKTGCPQCNQKIIDEEGVGFVNVFGEAEGY